MRAALRLLGVFLLCFLLRLALISLFKGPGFWGDSFADASIYPYRYVSGVSAKAWQTHLLSTFYYIGLYKLLGYCDLTAQLGNIFVYSLSTVLFFLSFKAIFNRSTAIVFLIVSSVTYPFLFHSIWPVCFGLSPIGPALTLYLLTVERTRSAMFLLGALCLASLLIYPGATLCSLGLLAAYGLVARSEIRPRDIGAACLGAGAATLPLIIIRLNVFNGNIAEWGGGWITAKNYLSNLSMLVNDTFVFSSSWDALNGEAPFVSLYALPILGAVLMQAVRMPSSTEVAAHEGRRWIQILLLAGVFTLLITAPTGPYPGIRRCYPVIFFFYGAIAYGVTLLFSCNRAAGSLLAVVLIGGNLVHSAEQFSLGRFVRRTKPSYFAELEKLVDAHTGGSAARIKTVVLDLNQGKSDLFSESTSSRLGWRYISSDINVYSATSYQSFGELASPVLVVSDQIFRDRDAVRARIKRGSKKDCAISESICPVDRHLQIYYALASCSERGEVPPPVLSCPPTHP